MIYWLIASVVSWALVAYWIVTKPRVTPVDTGSRAGAALSLSIYVLAFSLPIPAVLILVT